MRDARQCHSEVLNELEDTYLGQCARSRLQETKTYLASENDSY